MKPSKALLQHGDEVKYRIGLIRIYNEHRKWFMTASGEGSMPLFDYDGDLKLLLNAREYDVIEVYRNNKLIMAEDYKVFGIRVNL